MNSWKLGGCMAAVVAAGILGTQLPGSAQKKGARTDVVVGFVDLTQITEQIKDTQEWKVAVRQFEEERAKFRNEIEDLTKLRFLSAAERQELQLLRAKQKPTDGEKARIGELQDRSSGLDREFQQLAMVEKPTADQKKRLDDLRQMREKASGDLQDEYDKRTQLLQKKEAALLEDMQGRIEKHVQQVAENKGVTLVVDRQAVLYGGENLTSDVLSRLGAGKK